jgi:hypothetical protein
VTHFIERCREHGTVYGQCRCPGPKAALLVDCRPDLCLQPTVSGETVTGAATVTFCAFCPMPEHPSVHYHPDGGSEHRRSRPPFEVPPVDWGKYRDLLTDPPEPDPDAALRYAQAAYATATDGELLRALQDGSAVVKELPPDHPTAKALTAALDRRQALDEAADIVHVVAAALRDEMADAAQAGRDTGNLHTAIGELARLAFRIRRARPWARSDAKG